MASVKITVSLDKALFEKVDALAKEMGQARSQVFALALEEYLQRHETRRLMEQINAAYEDDLDPEERATLEHMRRLYLEVLKREDE